MIRSVVQGMSGAIPGGQRDSNCPATRFWPHLLFVVHAELFPDGTRSVCTNGRPHEAHVDRCRQWTTL